MRDFWRGQANAAAFATRLHRLERPLRLDRPLPDRVRRLHHGPRRLHARRPRLVRAQAQRGEPRGQPRRQQRQPLLELRRRGADRRPRDPRAAGRVSSATCSRRCSCRRECRCWSQATSAAGRSSATTTRGARTTRSRGSTGCETESRNRAARVHPPAAGAPRRARRLPAYAIPRRRPCRFRAAGRLVVPSGRPADGPARLAERHLRHLGVFLNGRRRARSGGGASIRRSSCSSTARPKSSRSGFRRDGSASNGKRCSTHQPPRFRTRHIRVGPSSPFRGAPFSFSVARGPNSRPCMATRRRC